MRKVKALTEAPPALPDFSRCHEPCRPQPQAATPEADIRRASFPAYDEEACEDLPYEGAEIDQRVARGRETVSAILVISDPPGVAILVPGQVVSRDVLDLRRRLDARAIHGPRPGAGPARAQGEGAARLGSKTTHGG